MLEYLSPKKQHGRLDSHQREIKTLRAQLDIERFEKSDLQEEVNQQYDKNKKLGKLIACLCFALIIEINATIVLNKYYKLLEANENVFSNKHFLHISPYVHTECIF